MDKVIFKGNDVNDLLSWRNENKALVRRGVMPIKAIQMIFPDTKISIKCIRKTLDNVTFQINQNGISKGAMKIKVKNDGYVIDKIPKGYNEENVMSVVTVYFSLMALMTYGDGVNYTPQELDVLDSVVSKTKKLNKEVPIHTKKQTSITYLLHRGANGRISVGSKGHHNSPKGEFNVRGHFRHYSNGNVVWIDEYKKGTGKRKDKIYRF